ncbi:MAG: bifunctional phosphoglucose/phosphomannose isomerase [Candidatus Edwardsbacteria bacterium]
MKTELDDIKYLVEIDKLNMQKHLADFPQQCQEGIEIGKKFPLLKFDISRIKNIVIAGMGGSAIGGDLLRSYLIDELSIPLSVVRNYTLPAFVGKQSLVIVSSYSGNTEETLSCYQIAKRQKAHILCITSGGELKKMALQDKFPVISISPNLPPRAALGYSFFPLLICLIKNEIVRRKEKEIKETISLLENLRELYSPQNPFERNKAKELAFLLKDKLAIFYSSADHLETVALRWRNQLNENAKMLAYSHTFPELNHNEIVGWEVLKKIMKETVVVLLQDKSDHLRNRRRMEITQEIMATECANFITVESMGRFLLSRIFSLIYLGDYVSLYLAVLNKVDPTPVKAIDYLKLKLSEKPFGRK